MKKLIQKINNYLIEWIPCLIVIGTALICTVFLLCGTKSENGSITLDGSDAVIEEYTTKFIEDANDALYRIMNEDVPTDQDTIDANDEVEVTGQGSYTTIDAILSRVEADGNNDNGLGWQCSKYTAYLATGKREYSTTHTDYGPVNGKNVAEWLVKNYGFKYIDEPVKGAIGSGGFNTTYGHTALYLYSTGTNTAMVNDANYTPLAVSTHNMNISGWVWVVPDSYEEPDDPDDPITPDTPVSTCSKYYVKSGDTLGAIMKECEGYVDWSVMDDYAKLWKSTVAKPNQTVYEGWISPTGVGLYAGDIIVK